MQYNDGRSFVISMKWLVYEYISFIGYVCIKHKPLIMLFVTFHHLLVTNAEGECHFIPWIQVFNNDIVLTSLLEIVL